MIMQLDLFWYDPVKYDIVIDAVSNDKGTCCFLLLVDLSSQSDITL